jgi:uncharacterized protein YndB with AHSA1/START domain
MTRTPSAPTVRIQRVIAAAPDRVFAAWIDPDRLAQWMSPVGRAEAEVEPWVGGRLRVTMIGDGVRIEHQGEYRDVVPDRRLVFTWQSPYTGPEPSIVTVELEPSEAGTVLTLIHEQLPIDRVESHRNGWRPMLDRLAELVSDKQGG